MNRAKIAITLNAQTIRRVDKMVAAQDFPSRSRAIEAAIEEKLERYDRRRLARESAKLDPKYERALAEQGISEDLGQWPEY